MSITNNLNPSGTPFTDLSTREVLATETLMLLADRDISILNHPALMHATGAVGTSNVVRVPHVGLGGYDTLTATTPGSEITATALASGHTDVTVVSRAKRYSGDDMARFVIGQNFSAPLLAQDSVISVGRTLISLIANVTDDFTAQEGTSGADLTWDDIYAAKAKLRNAGASGPILCVLHPYQWAQLERDAGTLGYAPAMSLNGVINAGLGNYVGTFAGVDFYTSNAVPTANAGVDLAGALITRGGVAWADMMMEAANDPNIIDLGRARFERVRKGEFLATSYVTSYHCGVSKALDGAGVTLISRNGI
jgi:hypothetical protein